MKRDVSTTSGKVSVTLCLGSGSYAPVLAEVLHREKMLTRAIRLTPHIEVLEPNDGTLVTAETFPKTDLLLRAMWAAWRRTPFTGRSHLPVVVSSRIGDRIVSERLLPANVLHGLTGNALASLVKAKRHGMATLLEHRMAHPRHWQREVLEECKRWGVRPRDCDTVLPEPLIRRREREFELSDRIIVPSRFVQSTFAAEGLANTDLVLPGIDEDIFHPRDAVRASDLFRVCYTGRMELGKGVHYLLEAWRKLRLANAELVLMGDVRPEMVRTLSQYLDGTIRLTGFLPKEMVAEELRRSSLFVFPSLHEGLAQSLLEAMASGIPAITTPNAGAEDCVTDGQDGFVVPARNADALVDSIAWCYRNRDELNLMGNRARARVEADFTRSCYQARVLEFYSRVERGMGVSVE